MADDQMALQRARHGDREAFDEIYAHHSGASWRLALVAAPHPSVASSAVISAFARVCGPSTRRDVGRHAPVGVQLLHASRTAAISGVASSDAEVVEPVGAGTTAAERAINSFNRLPEQWRTVLWLRDVERVDLAGAAAVLGLSEQSTAPLADRALDGLRKQLSRAHVRTAAGSTCEPTAVRLSRYVAGTLTDRDAQRVRRHLDRCEDCRQRLDEVDDLAPRLRRHVPSAPPELALFAVEAWLDRTQEAAGPLGLHLPGGRPAPAWAERALTGAAAAMVTLGITAAVALGARDGESDEGPVAQATGQPIGAPDGESALSGELPGEGGTDGGGSGGSTSTGSVVLDPAPAPRGGQSDDAAAPPADARPPAAPAPAAPTPTPSPSTPPSQPPTTTPPAPDEGIVGGVDDTLEPLDLCTGVGPLDDLVGCDSAEGTNPLGGLGL